VHFATSSSTDSHHSSLLFMHSFQSSRLNIHLSYSAYYFHLKILFAFHQRVAVMSCISLTTLWTAVIGNFYLTIGIVSTYM